MNDKNEEVINELFGILDCHEHYYEARDEVFAFLTNILTAERAKNPGVWDGAPDDAEKANVMFYKTYPICGGSSIVSTGSLQFYTRELPKTRVREFAEARAKTEISIPDTEVQLDVNELADVIESAILKYAESIK